MMEQEGIILFVNSLPRATAITAEVKGCGHIRRIRGDHQLIPTTRQPKCTSPAMGPGDFEKSIHDKQTLFEDRSDESMLGDSTIDQIQTVDC